MFAFERFVYDNLILLLAVRRLQYE